MGFGILAFESGLYECGAATDLFRKGKVRKGMDASASGIWRVEETLPLFRYLAGSAGGRAPLGLSGFDLAFAAFGGEAGRSFRWT